MEGFRYPGVKPFSTRDKDLFFGRDEDISRLFKLIKTEQLLLIYSKSGLGKSSILNAGIIPKFEESNTDKIVNIRFGVYREENAISPIDILLEKIKTSATLPSFLNIIGKIDENDRLWYQLKLLQFESEKSNIVFILDQFEELFTYPEPYIRAFKRQVADVLNVVVPQKYRNNLEKNISNISDSTYLNQLERFYHPLNVKLVFAIRSDKMSLIDQLKDTIPHILNKTYELTALNYDQAEDAILNPAYKKDDGFISHPFDFKDSTLDEIIDYLSKGRKQKIESFQLQIICQYIESLVIEKGLKLIDIDSLGEINKIFENYYDNLIQKLPTEDEQTKARIFIEEKLIYEEDKTRLSIYEGQILKDFNVGKDLLAKLVNSHLVRAEPNTAGGFSYELSHDTLVEPILKAKAKRVEKLRVQEEREIAEAERVRLLEQQEKIAQRQKLKYTNTFLRVVSIFAIISLSLFGWALSRQILIKKTARQLVIKQDSLKFALASINENSLELKKANDSLKSKQKHLELLVDSVNILKEKAENATLSERSKNALLIFGKKIDSLTKLYADDYNEREWYNALNRKEKDAAINELVKAENDPIRFNQLKSSFTLAGKANDEANTDIKLSLQRAAASVNIDSNWVTNNVLRGLLKRNLYKSRIVLDEDIKDILYNKNTRRVIYVTKSGIFSDNINDIKQGTSNALFRINPNFTNNIVNTAVSSNEKFMLIVYDNKLLLHDNEGNLVSQRDSVLIESRDRLVVSDDGQQIGIISKRYKNTSYDRDYSRSYAEQNLTTIKIYSLKDKAYKDSISDIITNPGTIRFSRDFKSVIYAKKGQVIVKDIATLGTRPLILQSGASDDKDKDLNMNPVFLTTDSKKEIDALTYSNDGKYLLVGYSNGDILIYDTSGHKHGRYQCKGAVLMIQFSPDGDYFYVKNDNDNSFEDDEPEQSGSNTTAFKRIKFTSTASDGDVSTSLVNDVIIHRSDAVKMIDEQNILSYQDNKIFIWDVKGQKIKRTEVNTFAQDLPMDERIEYKLTDFNTVLNKGDKNDLYEAALVCKKKLKDIDIYDSSKYVNYEMKISSLLLKKFHDQLGKPQLENLYTMQADAYDYNLKHVSQTDSLTIKDYANKSISFRKQAIYLNGSSYDSIIDIKTSLDVMANYFYDLKLYDLSLSYRILINSLLTNSYRSDSSNKFYLLELCLSYYDIGDLFENLKDYRKELDYHSKYLDISELAHKKFPEDESISARWLWSYYWKAKSYANLQDYTNALSYLLKLTDSSTEIYKKFPENVGLARIWSMSDYYTSEVFESLNDYHNILKYQKKSLEKGELAHKQFPEDATITQNWFVSYYSVAKAYENLKSYDEVLEYRKKYLERAEIAHEQLQENLSIAREWMLAYYHVGKAYENLKNYDSTLVFMKKFKDVSDRLHRQFPKANEITYQWEINNSAISKSYENLKNYETALIYRTKNKEVVEKLHFDFQDDQMFSERYVANYFQTARLYKKMKDYKQALEFHKKCQEACTQNLLKFTNDTDLMIMLANSYLETGEICFILKDYKKYLEFVAQGNTINENLVKSEIFLAGDNNLKEELANSYARLANAFIFSKKLTKAEEMIKKSFNSDSSSSFYKLVSAEISLIKSDYNQASTFYSEIKNEPYGSRFWGREEFTYGERALIYFEQLEKNEIIDQNNSEVIRIKEMLRKIN